MGDERKILIEESCLPVIGSGTYHMTAYVDAGELGMSQVAEERFHVEGPRFCLNKEDVVSVYPADGLKGGFERQLPHVVLGRKSLPWERSIKPETGERYRVPLDEAPTKEVPWLFVLLLHEDEITNIQYDKVENVIRHPVDTFFPELYLESESNIDCGYIDLNLSLFERLVPSEEELVFLAHARKLENAVTNCMDYQGEWVSILVGNRLPLSRREGGRNRAYLVSLEGFEGWRSKINEQHNSVRLIVLYSWEFFSVPEQAHFLQICHGLDVKRLHLPAQEKIGENLGSIEENGYLPMVHEMRQGSKTVSFYRGPFSPVRTQQNGMPKENLCTDGLYQYDPETGVFDVSYAAAWQLGRILALGNLPVSKEILRLRAKGMQRTRKQIEREMLQQEMEMEMDQDGDVSKWLMNLIRERGTEIL